MDRIRRIARYRSSIFIYQEDAEVFICRMDDRLPKRSMLCADPPYFHKGSLLYTSLYRPEDHASLARCIKQFERPWVVTYDLCPEIRTLYEGFDQWSFNVNYSVRDKRQTSELMVVASGLTIDVEGFGRLTG